MGPGDYLFIIIALAMLFFLALHSYSWIIHSHQSDGSSGDSHPKAALRMGTKKEILELLDLIKLQNYTIHVLEGRLKSEMAMRDKAEYSLRTLSDSANGGTASAASASAALAALKEQEEKERREREEREERERKERDEQERREREQEGTSPLEPTPYSAAGLIASQRLTTDFENDCESRYGVHLVEEWAKSKEIWCEPDSSLSSNLDELSSLECYPYHQKHKQLDGRGPDLFCVAKNMFVDFSKISRIDHDNSHKPELGSQYLQFSERSLFGSCKKTNQYNRRLFMPHQSLQFNTFVDHQKPPASYSKADAPITYALARDEDCENAFHSTADFMNVYLIKLITGMDFKDVQVMLYDRHPDGPFTELIKQAYSPNHDIIRASHYKGIVKFDQLVFHLESPAGLIFPKVARPDPLKCFDTTLFQAYRRYILQSFNLLNVAPPPIPTVTLILRHRTAKKNVGRVLGNEEEVIKVLQSGNMMKLNVVDLATMKYREQLELIRGSNVVVGPHGAGLMNIMFAAEEAVLVEIHPSYRQDRHFRHASRMTNKIYMPMRTTIRESCVGSSDTIMVQIDEFTKAMDGALRIARNFDDGISECGLVCPKSILALDDRLDRHYGSDSKGRPIDTRFPCY